MKTPLLPLLALLIGVTGINAHADELKIPNGRMTLSCFCKTGIRQLDQPFEVNEAYPISKNADGHTLLQGLLPTSWLQPLAIFTYEDSEFTIKQGDQTWTYEMVA